MKREIKNKKHTTAFLSEFKEWSKALLFAVLFTFITKSFLVDVVKVSGHSMDSTLKDGDRLVVEKVTLIKDNIKKGDIYILDPSSNVSIDEFFIKRVVATAGDKIKISEGQVYINDVKIEEQYLNYGAYTLADTDKETTIKEGYVFVMGDNRGNSLDSRKIGAIPVSKLKGHVLLRLFPFEKIK